MNVAVVGGGVYGCTAAIELARGGHHVDLYERHRNILYGASRANQGRLHSGYHYPRSPETAKAACVDAQRFAARFPGVIDRSNRHYYCISPRNSLTSAEEFLSFCGWLGSDYRVVRSWLAYEPCVSVPEALINIDKLRELLRRELREAGVTTHYGTSVGGRPVGLSPLDHDFTIMATYGQPYPIPLRYEVCETVLIKLGVHYAKHSFVILDGPFISLDPVPGRDLHYLYDVVHSVHAVNEVPEHLAPLLDRGPRYTEHTHRDAMLAGARKFLTRIGMPTYHGSLFTVRAVLPNVDATDERPTLIHREGQVVYVLAGKLDGAVEAAERIVSVVAA